MLKPKYERINAQEMSVYIETGEIDINDLSLNKKIHRDAFFLAISRRPNLLSKIEKENGKHFLIPAIEEKPSYFIYLKKEQYIEECAQKFLLYRLNEKVDKDNKNTKVDDNLSVQESLDSKVVLGYNFVAEDGDEINYFDNELQVPSSIKTNFKLILKIADAIKLLNKIDLNVAQLGRNKIITTVKDLIDNQYKVFLSEYITSRKAGYYLLCSNIGLIEKDFRKKLKEIFEQFGIEVCEFIIKRFAIPKDIQYKIEDQAFQIRQLRVENEANNEMAKNALENYETKLAIESKYPEVEHALTEYEKDLALKRYLIKSGRNEIEQINHNIGTKAQKDKTDSVLNKMKDVAPEIPEKTNVFKAVYFTLLCLSMIIDLFVFASSVNVGLILLGVLVLIFGTTGILLSEKLKKADIEEYSEREKQDLITQNTSSSNEENKEQK